MNAIDTLRVETSIWEYRQAVANCMTACMIGRSYERGAELLEYEHEAFRNIVEVFSVISDNNGVKVV